jgi:hypothetical protein
MSNQKLGIAEHATSLSRGLEATPKFTYNQSSLVTDDE